MGDQFYLTISNGGEGRRKRQNRMGLKGEGQGVRGRRRKMKGSKRS